MANALSNTPKRRINLTIRGDLLDFARAEGVNISLTAEQALSALRLVSEQERWAHDYAEGIASYNASIEADGLWSDGLTTFEAK